MTAKSRVFVLVAESEQRLRPELTAIDGSDPEQLVRPLAERLPRSAKHAGWRDSIQRPA